MSADPSVTSDVSTVAVIIMGTFDASVRARPKMTVERRTQDVLDRLVASGRWRRVRQTGPGAQSIDRTRLEREWNTAGVAWSTTLPGPVVRRAVVELHRRRQCRCCGQLRL